MIDSGIDVLIIRPLDVRGMKEIVEYAIEEQVKIIKYDSLMEEQPVDLFVGYDSEYIGQRLGRLYLRRRYIHMKLLITGGQGFLGTRAAAYYGAKHEVLALSHRELDITDQADVNQKMKVFDPDVVVHCAAVSDTGYTQDHPVESYQINVTGSDNIAKACAQYGAKMIFMSSDQVYNGNTIQGNVFQKGRDEASEGRDENPVSEYANQKLEAEQKCLRILPTTVCLRLTWMFDRKREDMKTNHNIITAIENAAALHETVSFSVHDYRGITCVWEVVKNLEQTFSWQGGVYNFGSGGCQNSYELASVAEEKMGYKGVVVPENERFMKKPRNLAMCRKKAEKNGVIFTDFGDQVEYVLRNLN